MNLSLNCPGCGRWLRVNEQFAGKTVRCPRCGTAYRAPSHLDPVPPRGRPAEDESGDDLYAPCERCGVLTPTAVGGGLARCANCRGATESESYRLADSGPNEAVFAPPAALTPMNVTPAASPPPAVAPEAGSPGVPAPGASHCPECLAPTAADAVVCLACGFNRATGKRLRTVTQRVARRWDAGNFPYAARMIVFCLVVAACYVPAALAAPDAEWGFQCLFLPAGGGLLGVLLLGTFHRITVTTDPQGAPLLVRKDWLCFYPSKESVTDLTGFRTIRLTHGEASLGTATVALILVMCFFGVIPAVLLLSNLRRGGSFTLDVLTPTGIDGVPLGDPVVVYKGRSEKLARDIGDALEQIAGLRYG